MIFLRKSSKILSEFQEKWSKLHVFYITLVIKTLEPDIMFILFFFSLGQRQYRLRKKKFIEKSSRTTKLQLLKKIYCQYFPLCYQNRRFLAHQRDIYISHMKIQMCKPLKICHSMCLTYYNFMDFAQIHTKLYIFEELSI